MKAFLEKLDPRGEALGTQCPTGLHEPGLPGVSQLLTLTQAKLTLFTSVKKMQPRRLFQTPFQAPHTANIDFIDEEIHWRLLYPVWKHRERKAFQGGNLSSLH